MTVSILAWVLFWLSLDVFGDGRMEGHAFAGVAIWLAPVVSVGALLVRLLQVGVKPWWRMASAERTRAVTRAAFLFFVLGAALFLWLEIGAEPSPNALPLWQRLSLHGIAVLVLTWVILPYSTLVDARVEEE